LTLQQKAHEYTFINYLAYTLYPPLYIAGPIITFDDFMAQTRLPPSITSRSISTYALRWLVSFLTMETILHYMYVVAIKDSRAWAGNTPFELAAIGWWNLIIIWLKVGPLPCESVVLI
jgi:D-alanyl-lipoteichoic acid acyltransferase DltB (MBOAT superfamily)